MNLFDTGIVRYFRSQADGNYPFRHAVYYSAAISIENALIKYINDGELPEDSRKSLRAFISPFVIPAVSVDFFNLVDSFDGESSPATSLKAVNMWVDGYGERLVNSFGSVAAAMKWQCQFTDVLNELHGQITSENVADKVKFHMQPALRTLDFGVMLADNIASRVCSPVRPPVPVIALGAVHCCRKSLARILSELEPATDPKIKQPATIVPLIRGTNGHQRKKLLDGLVKDGFLPENTHVESFNYIFGSEVSSTTVEPLKWFKSKASLVYFLSRLSSGGENEWVKAGSCFTDKNGNPFKDLKQASMDNKKKPPKGSRAIDEIVFTFRMKAVADNE